LRTTRSPDDTGDAERERERELGGKQESGKHGEEENKVDVYVNSLNSIQTVTVKRERKKEREKKRG